MPIANVFLCHTYMFVVNSHGNMTSISNKLPQFYKRIYMLNNILQRSLLDSFNQFSAPFSQWILSQVGLHDKCIYGQGPWSNQLWLQQKSLNLPRNESENVLSATGFHITYNLFASSPPMYFQCIKHEPTDA